MINELLTKYLDTQKIQYETHVDLKKRTWIHRGGIAGIFISPASADELETILSFLYSEDTSFLLIGHTSNLYILNECNIPVVVSTAKCRYFQIDDGQLFCEAGVGVINLSKQMIKQGIKGFEYLTGLPGTIGAALVNNSSCRENSISELLVSARVVLKDGSMKISNMNLETQYSRNVKLKALSFLLSSRRLLVMLPRCNKWQKKTIKIGLSDWKDIPKISAVL